MEPQSQPPLSSQIQVKQWDPTGGLAGDLRVAKLSFIDLAGSERACTTPGGGEGLWEDTSINRSLLALGSVIRALAGAKVRQLPARLRLSGTGPGGCPRARSRAEPPCFGTGRAEPCAVPGQQTDAPAEGFSGRRLPQHHDRGREPRGARRPQHLQHSALRQPGQAHPAAGEHRAGPAGAPSCCLGQEGAWGVPPVGISQPGGAAAGRRCPWSFSSVCLLCC